VPIASTHPKATPIATKTLPALPQSFFARPAEVLPPSSSAACWRSAQQLHQTLHLLKRNRCLNISAFCREAIAEKLEQLETVK